MKYAKLYNNKPMPFFGILMKDGKLTRNPTEADILAAGYLPLKDTAEPNIPDGFLKSSKWVQTDKAIVKKWSVKRDMRPMSQAAVSEMLIRQQINTLVVDDNTALRMRSYYPDFESVVGQKVKKDFKFTHDGKLWKTIQPEMTIESHYPPGVGTESLYTEVCETHDGTLYDAIPYEGNMALVSGLYYTQDGVVYICTRDTGNPVYHALTELVGLYVEAVE